MEILCTRPGCPKPNNVFPDLDDQNTLKTTQQKFCMTCGMPLILGGRYLPFRLLGRGGFGAAFLARDRYTTSLRLCVVKLFQPAGDPSPKQLEIALGLFQREAEVLEELGVHPQIPDSYAFFPLMVPSIGQNKEEQFFYLVQEYIDGEDLEREQAQKSIYSEAEVIEILQAILHILKFVHEHHSIHRDIKPSNIMRSKAGKFYLLDFGAVKQVTASAATPQGRSTGIYSMGFAPPEQMQGAQVYPSTDLYALACTALTLLTGKPPEDLYDSYSNDWNWRPHAPQVSDRLADVLDRMLLASPKSRFQSAQEVLNALQEPVAAPPPPKPVPPPPNVVQPPTTRSPAPSPAPPPPPTPSPAKSSFSLLEILGSAAFTGFSGVLLYITLLTFFGNPAISMGLWGATLGGLIYAQIRRLIEKWDLAILGGLSFLITWGMVAWQGFGFPEIFAVMPVPIALLMLGILMAAVIVLITTIFRLIYQLLSNVL
ncbi:serine/threonine-protein kinase [Spirulina subsalsa]|uniref:serine/threonine-protein kinase n=1 Tax=Spirulina subsalsa TaxID=54311 RepID=UPI0002D355BD|nr:serine/threonine-protein kinase [Spirulina subsalsa]